MHLNENRSNPEVPDTLKRIPYIGRQEATTDRNHVEPLAG